MLGRRGVFVASNSTPMNDQLLALFHERTLLMSDYAEQVLRKVPRAEIRLDPCSLLIDGRAMRGVMGRRCEVAGSDIFDLSVA